MRINLNEELTVELTAFGAEVYNEYYKEYREHVRPPLVRAGEVVKMQFWKIMRVYGARCFVGMTAVPFKDNTVAYASGKPTARLVRAENTLKAAGYQDCGGELWKPPLGAIPAWVINPNGWLIDGSLVYKLDETGTMNAFEINVTQAEGTRRHDGPRVALAQGICAMLSKQPISALTQAQIDQIAEGWDGCTYDAPGETIDIGASLRRALAQLEIAK